MARGIEFLPQPRPKVDNRAREGIEGATVMLPRKSIASKYIQEGVPQTIGRIDTVLAEVIPSKSDSSYTPEYFMGDVWEHNHLQRVFDTALGRSYEQKDMLQRSYNIVTDRWHIEKLRRKDDSEGIVSYKKEIRKNLELNLRERLQVSENTVRYTIKDGQLYSEEFPKEPFIDVLQRGIDYRLHHGTKEAEREGLPGELGGWDKLQAKFTDPDTALGTKITVFSPPGIIKDSSYDRQILDEYELMKDGDQKYLRLTRRIVDFTQRDYALAALSLDSHYFDSYDGRPLDAWYLSHPVEGSLKEVPVKGMDTVTFQKIYDNPLIQGLIDNYIAKVSLEDSDWQDLAKNAAIAFNAVLNQTDILERGGDQKRIPVNTVYLSHDFIHHLSQQLGVVAPETRGGAGCPSNKGYDLSNKRIVSGINSVSSFAMPGVKKENQWFSCSECGWEANGPIGDKPCHKCGFTKEEYVKKYGVECA
jgi:hypothetical protein